MIDRFSSNPLFTPADLKPSRSDLKIMCAFNPAATMFNGHRIILMRVAETPIPEKGYIATPVADSETGEVEIRRFRKDDPDVTLVDPRVFTYKGETFLTSLSHLRMATSDDGLHFKAKETPALVPSGRYETYGVEDPRITFLDGHYYINYTAASPLGVVTALARTDDFKNFERIGIAFGPDNKDVALFPEKIRGRYHAFHRPAVQHCGAPSIWLASSGDLRDWGRHEFVAGPRRGTWDCERVGAGSSPIKTEYGWLAFYHAADHQTRYCLGAMLLDLEEPWHVLARPAEPFFVPEAEYEVSGGFMPNVVFHNGTIDLGDGTLELYYGGGRSRDLRSAGKAGRSARLRKELTFRSEVGANRPTGWGEFFLQ
ncbi:MAG: glycoside hydrolase family 130 protein [Chthoniobacteraceae bacterium]